MFGLPWTHQDVTLDGVWQDHETHRQFTGTLSSSEPFVVLSLLKYGERYHYMKHRKADALSVPLTLHQTRFPHDNRSQPLLSIAHTVNTGTVAEGRVLLAEPLPLTWRTGHILPWAMDAQQQVCIALLAVAKVDIMTKRCGIWAVKSRVRDYLEKPWESLLSKTRHGFVHCILHQ